MSWLSAKPEPEEQTLLNSGVDERAELPPSQPYLFGESTEERWLGPRESSRDPATIRGFSFRWPLFHVEQPNPPPHPGFQLQMATCSMWKHGGPQGWRRERPLRACPSWSTASLDCIPRARRRRAVPSGTVGGRIA